MITLAAPAVVNSGDTAWVMVCAALVLFMTPGLALFYAGMDRSRNALVMLQQNLIPLGVVSVIWVIIGYSLAFGNDTRAGTVGNLSLFGMRDLSHAQAALHVISPGVAIPTLAFVAYQMMFAIITPALITGATADRLKFGGWALFVAAWSIVVYAPVAHWLFSPSGWLAQLGARDWAGGIVVHTSAGAAALALVLVVGRRRGWPHAEALPHSLPLTIAGAGILWFGWFGFNAGDGLKADGIAAQALLNTTIAASAGMLLWLLLERQTDGHPTVLGAVTGAVAGLATITPCAGYVNTLSAMAIGAMAGVVCYLALRAKFYFRFDDALDVIAVHFVGGVIGSLLLGFFAEAAINGAGANGVLFGGGARFLGDQALAVVVVVAYSFCLTWVIATVVEAAVGLRVASVDQDVLDQRQQGMAAYHLDRVSSLVGAIELRGAEARPAPDGGGPPRAAVRDTVRLVTGLVESVQADELMQALLDAGGQSIVLSNAHVYTGQPKTHVIRASQRQLEFVDRVRVEVLVPEDRVKAVLEALDRFSTGRQGGFVQVAEPTADLVSR